MDLFKNYCLEEWQKIVIQQIWESERKKEAEEKDYVEKLKWIGNAQLGTHFDFLIIDEMNGAVMRKDDANEDKT